LSAPLWKRSLSGLAVICMQNSGEIDPVAGGNKGVA